ncbi:CRTAC1 family protein [Vulgatibacter incomptus]|uniref:ASPIC/UnbV domain-containing protein n=1 Tax=Vulgatibacter incomptus TaxID=1391653 RepID=A0A0K1PI20_9BACT|nr:CRTAC1 family protein [Vulgatibacter incomptus]AKU93162.1 ASPIC/UnbV domain-containing protein [Vulgatibacter incomptus]
MRSLLLIGAVLLFAGCSSSKATGGTGGNAGSGPGEEPELCGGAACKAEEVCDPFAQRCVEALPSRCRPGTSWQPGMVAFRDATEKWGLAALGVEGTRLSVADIDGDGFPDLSARKVGTLSDDFAPGGVRATWLLRNVAGERFEDVTEASRLVTPRRTTEPRRGRPAEVVIWADVNNDGHVDAFTGLSNTDPKNRQIESSELMLNDGTGHFVLGPEDAVFRREGDAVSRAAAVFLDADRDGAIDLFLGNGAVNGALSQDQLYRGLGDGRFEEVTAAAGLTTSPWKSLDDLNHGRGHSNAWGAVACDLNGDGRPDLAVSSYGRAPNHLWQAADGEGISFVNRSVESGYAFDDRRDWRDNESARCWCKLHPDAEDCGGVPAPQLIRCQTDADAFRWNHATDREPYRLGGNSGTTVCADVNNDGAMDLVTTEIVHWDVGTSSDPSELLLNTGSSDVTFRRPGNEATGLARAHDRVDWNDGDITAAVFDFDNDGRPDLYIGSSDYPGTRGHLYWQREDGTFEEVPIDVGIDQKASLGIAVADFDGDGDLDVVVGHSRMRCEDQCYETATTRIFENVMGQDGNWIQLDLVGGPNTNRSAIGARVTVQTELGTQTQEKGGGHGHYGMQHDPVLHFGLGKACEAKVTIRWPDAALTEQRFTLQSGYRYRLEQGGVPVARR